MKLKKLQKHLGDQGCHLEREGGNYSLWKNPVTGKVSPVPRQREIKEGTVRAIQAVANSLSRLFRSHRRRVF